MPLASNSSQAECRIYPVYSLGYYPTGACMTPPKPQDLSTLSQEELDEMLTKDVNNTVVQQEYTRRGIDHNTGEPIKKAV